MAIWLTPIAHVHSGFCTCCCNCSGRNFLAVPLGKAKPTQFQFANHDWQRLNGKRPTSTLLDAAPFLSQISMTRLSMANGTRQPEPPSHSTEAVR